MSTKLKIAKIVVMTGTPLMVIIPAVAFAYAMGFKHGMMFLGLLAMMFVFAAVMAWASATLINSDEQ